MFVYGVSTVGATVHVHYCMDKVIGWDFSQPENNTCNKCGMKDTTKKGCCKDEVKQLKVDTDQQKSTVASFTKNLATPILYNYTSASEFILKLFNVELNNKFYSPPLIPSIQKLTVLYCTYRI